MLFLSVGRLCRLQAFRAVTPAEIRAYNAGIHDLLDIAATAAAKIGTEGKRPLAEGFAVAALTGLAESGRALLLTGPTATEKAPNRC